MSKEMEYVEALSEQIGARPATSEAEYQAAEWIADKYSQHNLAPEVQNFSTPATTSWTYAIYGLLAALAAAVSGLTAWLPFVSLVIGLLVAILFFTDSEMIWGLSHLFAKRPSQNIIARHVPRGGRSERSRKIVLVAHYDTPRSAAFPGIAHSTPLIFALTKWCTWIIPVLVLLQILIGVAEKKWVWYLSLLPAAFLLFTAIIHILNEVLGKDVDGANNNASGVASMLAVLDKVIPIEEDDESKASHTAGDRIASVASAATARETTSHLFGKEVIEDAGIAPSEAGIEYAVPVKSRLTLASSQTGKMEAVAPQEQPPASAGIIGKSEPVKPEQAAAPVELPAEGFPLSLTADEGAGAAHKPAAPSTPARTPAPAPTPSPQAHPAPRDEAPSVSVPPIGSQPAEQPAGTGETPALSIEIPSIDDIAMPGATQAFAPVGGGASKAPSPDEVPDMSAAFTPSATSVVRERVESWESSTSVTVTEEFTDIPDSRVRELGSQVTGMFAKIVPGRKKKKSKHSDEEEALGSWLDSGSKKSHGSNDPWSDDDDDFGWQGGAVLGESGEFAALSTEERIAAIKDSVLSVSDRDLLDKEVWFVATGAKEAGAFGMQAFVREYANDLRGALIVSIDSVGLGDLSWVTEEGTVKSHSADRRLVVLARRLARSEGINAAPEKSKGVATDALAALIKGHNAMTISAFDGAMPANYRGSEDSMQDIDPGNIADTVKLVTGIIRES